MDGYNTVVVRMVMVVCDPVLTVRVRVVMVCVTDLDVEMRGPTHVQVHRGQPLKGQDQRQEPGERSAPVSQRCRQRG